MGLLTVEAGKVAAGVAIAGGGESLIIGIAGAAGGAIAGKIAADGVADHVMPPNGPAEPARPASPGKPASSDDNTASGEIADQPAPKRGTFKGDLTRLESEAAAKNDGTWKGAQGELDAIERLLAEGKNVEKRPDRGIPGQTEPDLLVDGELREIKTRHEPLNKRWIKDMINNAHEQIANSQYGENPQGSVDLQLKDQLEPDSQLLQKAERQVRGQFNDSRAKGLTSVRLYNEGRLLGEWIRIGDKIIQVLSSVQ